MKRFALAMALLVAWMGGAVENACAELTPTRKLSFEGTWTSEKAFPPDGYCKVTVAVQGSPDEIVRVEETVPPTWNVTHIGASGSPVSGRIVWDATTPSGRAQVSYYLRPSVKTKSGVQPFSGTAGGVPIGGKESIAYGKLEAGYQFYMDSFKVFNYFLYLPKGYDSENRLWPLMMFFHGTPNENIPSSFVKSAGPPKYAANPDQPFPLFGLDGFPFFVVSIHSPQSHWDGRYVMEILDHVRKRFPIDPNRIYLTGFSHGGMTTWDIGAQYPDLPAAMIPICGFTEPKMAPRLAHIPIWVFHGEKDTVIPVSESRKMVQALEEAGGNVQLTVYPGVGHDSWTKAYADPELYRWLLKQQKGTSVGEWMMF